MCLWKEEEVMKIKMVLWFCNFSNLMNGMHTPIFAHIYYRKRCWVLGKIQNFHGICRLYLAFVMVICMTLFKNFWSVFLSWSVQYCNGFDQRVAKQWLCKHGPMGNSRWGCVFYVIRAMPSACNRPMNSQADMTCVFCVVHAEELWEVPE
jgi:hypothetical protein